MSDGDAENDPGGNRQALLPANDEAVRELVDLEKRRIDRDNRRSSLMEKALELADAQDVRQFEYASATRDANLELRRERLTFLRQVSWAGVTFVAFLILALLGFALFGRDEQRDLVGALAVPGLIGLAGYGVLTTLVRVVKAFAKDE